MYLEGKNWLICFGLSALASLVLGFLLGHSSRSNKSVVDDDIIAFKSELAAINDDYLPNGKKFSDFLDINNIRSLFKFEKFLFFSFHSLLV